DARTLTPEAVGTFDRVLLDAPCSGTGVLARRADLRWNRSEADMTDLVRLQDELLDAATGLVRPGGLLVYGTCTLEPEENEDRVHAFLSRHRAFEVEDLSPYVEESVMTHESFLATLPHEHGIDGA